MADWLPPVLAVATAIILNAGGWFLVSRQKRKIEAETVLTRAEARKTDADTADTLTGASMKIVDRLQKDVERQGKQIDELRVENARKDIVIAELEERIDHLETKVELRDARMREFSALNADLLKGTADLSTQLRDMGEEPVWSR